MSLLERQLSYSPDPTSSQPPAAQADVVAPLVVDAATGATLLLALAALVALANWQKRRHHFGNSAKNDSSEAGNDRSKAPTTAGFLLSTLAAWATPPGLDTAPESGSAIFKRLWKSSIADVARDIGPDAATVCNVAGVQSVSHVLTL